MGYVLSAAGFARAMGRLGEDRLIYAPPVSYTHLTLPTKLEV